MDDPRVRQAIRLICDRDEMVNRVLAGHGSVAGLELAATIAERPELDAFRGARLFPEPGEGLEGFVRRRAETLYHPVGTCRMGGDPDSVVDHRLAVHGIDDLWVADASVMPAITTGHPNAAAVAIGERAARFCVGASGWP